jgi:hypothetical protein
LVVPCEPQCVDVFEDGCMVRTPGSAPPEVPFTLPPLTPSQLYLDATDLGPDVFSVELTVPPGFEETGTCDLSGAPFTIITTNGSFSGTTSGLVFRGADDLVYNRLTSGGRQLGVYNWQNQTTVFNGLVSDPGGLNTGGSGGMGVSKDGSTLYFSARNINSGRILFINNSTKTIVKRIGTGGTFPNAYNMFAGASGIPRFFNQVHTNGVDQLITVIQRNDFDSSSRISVFNPNMAPAADPNRDYHVGTATELLGGNLGWPVIDKNLHVWTVSVNQSTQAAHVIELVWDINRNALDSFEEGAEETEPATPSSTDVSSSIISWGSGDLEAPTTWIEVTNQLLFVINGRAYLFDCASKTIVGAGVHVDGTGPGGNRWLNSIVYGGVGNDGKILFQDTEFKLNELDVSTWTLSLRKYNCAIRTNNCSGGGGYVPEYGAWVAIRGTLSGSGNLGAAQLICLDTILA